MEKTNIYTDEERYWMTGGRTGTLPTRIIPSVIYSLAPSNGKNMMQKRSLELYLLTKCCFTKVTQECTKLFF